jgi:hypothetical protein
MKKFILFALMIALAALTHAGDLSTADPVELVYTFVPDATSIHFFPSAQEASELLMIAHQPDTGHDDGFIYTTTANLACEPIQGEALNYILAQSLRNASAQTLSRVRQTTSAVSSSDGKGAALLIAQADSTVETSESVGDVEQIGSFRFSCLRADKTPVYGLVQTFRAKKMPAIGTSTTTARSQNNQEDSMNATLKTITDRTKWLEARR